MKGGEEGEHAARRWRVAGESSGQSRSRESMERLAKWTLEAEVLGKVTTRGEPLR